MSELTNIDLFEKENARDLTAEQLVSTFVPTDTYYKLLSGRNQIVLGSRGSGKTSIAKMLSHYHLSLFVNYDETAKDIINNKKFIGIYVAMSTEWLGGVNNKKWQTESENDFLFTCTSDTPSDAKMARPTNTGNWCVQSA